MNVSAKKLARQLCLVFAFFFVSPAFADWDPEYCFPDEDLSALDDLIFQNLKRDMVYSLKGSWCSEEKANLLMDLIYLAKPEVCVEVGVFSGSTVLPVATVLKYLQHGNLIAIDAWSNAEAIKNMEHDDPNRAWWSQVYMDGIYQMFITRLAERALTSYCRIFRNPSDVAAHFVDEIDFLHLDGDYCEKGSIQDVQLYLPKVKSGGYILLSNLFVMVKGKAPKMKSFSLLFDACEMICEIDKDNAILFRKN
jgi:hypothetical protein